MNGARSGDWSPRLLVIGAGPAGVSTAIRLRDRGLEVLLVDRAAFPRDKICGCCLNLAALRALSRIGCDQPIRNLTQSTLQRWELRVGRRRASVRLPGGVAVSRIRMDATLVEVARQRGVWVRDRCEARVLDVQRDRVIVTLGGDQPDEQRDEFDGVVMASGLSGGGVSKWLPFVSSPTGPIGVSTIVPPLDAVRPHTIHMICGRLGYVGLVRLEDGRVDMAAAIRRPFAESSALNRAEIATRIDQLLGSAELPALASSRVDDLRMTPPLTRARMAGCGSLIAVGDAARYIEPFTGEGMAWAIESGIAAADCIANRVALGRSAWGSVADDWSHRYCELIRRRQWPCRLVSTALGSASLAKCLVPAIRLAPWAARRIVCQIHGERD